MSERQTKENLTRVIDEEIRSFGLEYKQILTITSDNGQNMLSTVLEMKKLFCPGITGSLASILSKENALLGLPNHAEADNHTEAAEDVKEEEEEDEENGEDIHEDEQDIFPENDDFTEGYEGDTDNSVTVTDDDDEFTMDILESVRCGAHTAQLAVWDVLREYKTRLSNINKKCLRMHRRNNRQLFEFHKISLPPKACETRWNVWYLLLRYLKELEKNPFLSILKNNDPDIGKH